MIVNADDPRRGCLKTKVEILIEKVAEKLGRIEREGSETTDFSLLSPKKRKKKSDIESPGI